MNTQTINLLKKLTNKEEIKLVSRGNKAILYALKIAKELNKTKVFIQDQGGWLTYKQFPKELDLELNILTTNYGLIRKEDLTNIDKDSALLMTSMTGYFAVQDMEMINKECKEKNCLLINDITGTVGTKEAKIGDILVCSFGGYKPINLGKGGLIAAKKDLLNLTQIEEVELIDLNEKLKELKSRLALFQKTNKKIKEDLKDYNIIHKNKKGINVAVKYKDEEEKQKITDYCEKNNFKYKICKKISNSTSSIFSFIKVNEDVISIEVQRL